MATAPIVVQVVDDLVVDEDTKDATKPLMTASKLLEELSQDPTRVVDPDEVKHLVEEEFPSSAQVPTAAELEDSILTTGKNTEYRLGNWVERIGNDMIWHLEPIRRISRKVNLHANGKEEVHWYYKTDAGILCEGADIRASREGKLRAANLL